MDLFDIKYSNFASLHLPYAIPRPIRKPLWNSPPRIPRHHETGFLIAVQDYHTIFLQRNCRIDSDNTRRPLPMA